MDKLPLPDGPQEPQPPQPTQNASDEAPDNRKEWKTPELIIEPIPDATQGGSGRVALLASEDKVTTYYHS